MNKTTLQQNNCDWQWILSSASGRRALYRLLQAAQIEQHGFVPADAYATAFHCGQRSIGLFLLQEIENVTPGIYAKMKEEYTQQLKLFQDKIDRQSEELANE